MPRQLGIPASLLLPLFHLSKSSSQRRLRLWILCCSEVGDQGRPLEITLDEVVEVEPDLDGEGEEEVEFERREEEEEEEEESQYEEDYSDELERRSYTPPSDVEVRSRKRSSDELEDAEADEADWRRGGTPPKRARKGERYAAEDEDGVEVKLRLRKRGSEELDDADEDGGGRGGGCGNNNKRVRVDDSSPAESPRTSTTATSDVSSLADEECRDRVRDGRVSEVDLDRLYVLADEED